MSAVAVLGSTGAVASKPASTRCSYNCCRKKLGLMPMICRCGISFCMNHFPAEEHACSFDYRADGKKLLTEQVRSCQGEKVEKL